MSGFTCLIWICLGGILLEPRKVFHESNHQQNLPPNLVEASRKCGTKVVLENKNTYGRKIAYLLPVQNQGSLDLVFVAIRVREVVSHVGVHSLHDASVNTRAMLPACINLIAHVEALDFHSCHQGANALAHKWKEEFRLPAEGTKLWDSDRTFPINPTGSDRLRSDVNLILLNKPQNSAKTYAPADKI